MHDRMGTSRVVWVALAAAVSLGCSSSTDSDPDFGRQTLATLDEACEGIDGLNGQAVLDEQTDLVASTLAYVTATGGTVSPTAVTIVLVWPATPVAVCYPAYTSGPVVASPRVAIEGLSMRFTTADGEFDEELPAKAWITSVAGLPGPASAVAVTSRGALSGTWTPFADYDNGGTTVAFVSRLAGASSSLAGGNVGLSSTTIAEANAGIFRSGNAVAIWPASP